ncbi:MAG: hypothetical protein V8R55_06415 [Dysosmobacter sp.]
MCEAQEAAQANVNAKTATADALYATLTSNEQGILLEVRRFAPAAYHIPDSGRTAASMCCAAPGAPGGGGIRTGSRHAPGSDRPSGSRAGRKEPFPSPRPPAAGTL